MKKATMFLNERGRSTADLKLVQRDRQQVGARPSSTKEANYHVFNQGTDKGFVIIAGDGNITVLDVTAIVEIIISN